MGGQQRNMEGDNEQRRRAAREARAESKRPQGRRVLDNPTTRLDQCVEIRWQIARPQRL
jgi:hypothetical protein